MRIGIRARVDLSLARVTRKILWGAKIQQSPPTVAYEEVMSGDEKGVLKWLSNVVHVIVSFASDCGK